MHRLAHIPAVLGSTKGPSKHIKKPTSLFTTINSFWCHLHFFSSCSRPDRQRRHRTDLCRTTRHPPRHLAPTMNSGEVFDGASPGPASSACAWVPWSMQAERHIVRIPGRMMLDLLLEQLDLPVAIYSRRGYLNNTMSVTVLFWTSVHNNGSCRAQMSITGIRSSDEAAAEDSAFVAAIRYIEDATNTVVKDLNYECLNRMERDFGYIRLRLNEAFDMINKLAKGYLYAVRYMSSFADQLHDVIAHAFPPTRAVDKSTNDTLMNIEVVAHNLKDRSNQVLDSSLTIVFV